MAKFMVLYQQPKDQEKFDDYYKETHIPLVHQMPNLKNATVHYVVNTQNSEADYYLIAELEFENIEVLQASFASVKGKKVQEDGVNLAPFLHHPPVIVMTK